MTDANKEASEAIKTAVDIAALPLARREKHYAAYRKTVIKSMMKDGFPPDKGEQYAHKVEQWIRAMVKIIETRGDAGDG